MRLPPPYPQIPAADETGKMHRGWVNWLRTLFETLGWAKDVKVYGDIQCIIENGAYAAFDGDIQRPELADGTTTIVQFSGKIPNDYKNGTDLEWYAEYAVPNANGGRVVWQGGYAIGGSGDVLSETNDSQAQTVPSAAKAVGRVEFTTISGTSLVKNDTIVGKVERTGGAVLDTYGSSVFLLGVGFKYRREGIGNEKAHP